MHILGFPKLEIILLGLASKEARGHWWGRRRIFLFFIYLLLA